MTNLDPFALEITEESVHSDDEPQAQTGARWEHEDLAQVRIKVLRGHLDSVTSCQFCDNDTKLLTAGSDKNIILWDFESGANLNTYQAHSSTVSRARASPNSSRFISVGWDKNIYMWSTETGRILWSGQHTGIVTCCAFSNDGKYVVTGSDLDNTIKLWDAQSGDCVKTLTDIHKSTVTSCMFSPKDDRIVSTSMDRTAKFYDISTCKTTVTLEGHTNVISNAAFSADERNLATTSWDKNIALWDISTGTYRSNGPQLIEKAHEGSISCCTFSDDGMILASGGYDSTVALWDIVGEEPVQKLRLQGHSDWVEDVSYSKSGKWLISCSKDKTVRLWNIEDTDKIPLVLENRRSYGLKMYKCSSCGKPFSVAQLENPKEIDLCVFCRLQSPNKGRSSLSIDALSIDD